jgi:hypothetical protein
MSLQPRIRLAVDNYHIRLAALCFRTKEFSVYVVYPYMFLRLFTMEENHSSGGWNSRCKPSRAWVSTLEPRSCSQLQI